MLSDVFDQLCALRKRTSAGGVETHMPNDRSERKTYRKSPGRQYGYEYDPLRSRSGRSQHGRVDETPPNERWSNRGERTSQSTSVLAQRPDLRRTRQLLRQNILANKVRPEDYAEPVEDETYDASVPPRMAQETFQPSRRSSVRSVQLPQPRAPLTRKLEEQDEWADFDDEMAIDPDLGYEDPLDARLGYVEDLPVRPYTSTLRNTPPRQPTRGLGTGRLQAPDMDDDYEEDEEESGHNGKKKGKISRRGLLLGMGAVAIGGASVAAYELAPKLPQALGDAGANIEHQLQDAFNQGVAQGADAVRKEFVTALDNLEGVSLEGAITAARLTRVAYDVFVSPVIKFGATVTGDFLGTMLSALKTARGWLAGAYQDNGTLVAIQKVLETWVSQVNLMPKQLDAITQTDLDGAQAYLRALQRKIDDEKAKLNGVKPTPTANPTPKTGK